MTPELTSSPRAADRPGVGAIPAASGVYPPAPGGRPGREWAWLALVLLLAGGWLSVLLWRAPARLLNDDFINAERGQNLFIADRLLAGQRLYADVLNPYGPLPFWTYAAMARPLGNTARNYLLYVQAFSLLGIAGFYAFARRQMASAAPAAAWTVLAGFPVFLTPGATHENLNTLYPVWDRLFLLGIALAWTPPARRGVGRALGLGMLLGGMQWCKFGGAVVAGGALLLADGFVLGADAWRDRAVRGRWLRACVATLAGFLLLEGARVAWAFATLPGPVAWRFVWPSYHLRLYASYRDLLPGFFRWYGSGYFVGQELPVYVGLALGLGLLGWRLVGRPAWPERAGAALFLAALLPLGLLVGYLPHRFPALGWAWLPVAAGAGALAGLRWPGRAAVMLLCVPCFLVSLNGRLAWRGAPEAARPWDFPNGERLWVGPAAHDRIAAVQATLTRLAADAGKPPTTLAVPVISGWEHYFGFRPPGGQYVWMSAALLPAADEAALPAVLDRTSAVLILSYAAPLPAGGGGMTGDPTTWGRFLDLQFGPAANAVFADRLGPPVRVDDRCLIFPVRPGAGLPR